jgi:hypothetical protein
MMRRARPRGQRERDVIGVARDAAMSTLERGQGGFRELTGGMTRGGGHHGPAGDGGAAGRDQITAGDNHWVCLPAPTKGTTGGSRDWGFACGRSTCWAAEEGVSMNQGGTARGRHVWTPSDRGMGTRPLALALCLSALALARTDSSVDCRAVASARMGHGEAKGFCQVGDRHRGEEKA